MESVPQEGQKRNRGRFLALETLFPAIILVLVAVASFGLGRLSALSEARTAATIGQIPAAAAMPTIAPGGRIVASKTGQRYHHPWCAGAQAMKEENKVWFDSPEEARAAGYTPAANCAGLE